jgi:hypothetical protein
MWGLCNKDRPPSNGSRAPCSADGPGTGCTLSLTLDPNILRDILVVARDSGCKGTLDFSVPRITCGSRATANERPKGRRFLTLAVKRNVKCSNGMSTYFGCEY